MIVAPAASESFATDLSLVWPYTRGDRRVRVAVLDGPADLAHPCFAGAELTVLGERSAGESSGQAAHLRHGTHVASLIFGQPGSPLEGGAPGCSGLLIPVFQPAPGGNLRPCSQLDLARAIERALAAGASVINISGGQLDGSGQAEPVLARAVESCAKNNVLLVAAAGNEGCPCLHVPAAVPTVLVVGAMDAAGEPLDFSNWGHAYRPQGVLALGENVVGATPGGGTDVHSGTSFATPQVAALAALLLSVQWQRLRRTDARQVREAILSTAVDCRQRPVPDCRRLLAGRVNVAGALQKILLGVQPTMNDPLESVPGERPSYDQPPAQVPASSTSPATGTSPMSVHYPVTSASPAASVNPAASVSPAACGCGGGGGGQPSGLVFALGQLAYDFGTEANRDLYAQCLEGPPEVAKELLRHLAGDEWVNWLCSPDAVDQSAGRRFPAPRFGMDLYRAEGLTWLLVQDATPIYAIRPAASFAAAGYRRLIEFLGEQIVPHSCEVDEEQEEHVAVGDPSEAELVGVAAEAGGESTVAAMPEDDLYLVAISGRIVGQQRLLSGQIVPVVEPDLRGTYNWTLDSIVGAVSERLGLSNGPGWLHHATRRGLRAYAQRIYHEFRNLGLTAQDRALNYSATNLHQVASVFQKLFSGARRRDQTAFDRRLSGVRVQRSAICRPGSDCWDVELTFFNPLRRLEEARQVYLLTIDVSGVVPVTVGQLRSWETD
ncbi:MAG: S8 family serine peptidase [Pirellulaceae bacterium]|nr:S8 family serine peptidase [Pirellulaceae bacterium]